MPQVQASNSSSSVPAAPGSATNTSASSAIRALRSCIESTTSRRGRPGCASSSSTRCWGMTPTTSPPAASAASATTPISPTLPAAVDDADAGPGQFGGEVGGRHAMGRRTVVGPGEDGDAHVSRSCQRAVADLFPGRLCSAYRAKQSTSIRRTTSARERHPAAGAGSLCSWCLRPTAGRSAPSVTGTGAERAPPASSCTATGPTAARCCSSTAPGGRTTAAPGARRAERCTRASRPTRARCARSARSWGCCRTTSSWVRSRSTTTAAGRTRRCSAGRLGAIEAADLRLDGESDGAAWLPLAGLTEVDLHPGLAASLGRLRPLLEITYQ